MSCHTRAHAEDNTAAAISDEFNEYIDRLRIRVFLEVQSLLVRADRSYPAMLQGIEMCTEEAGDELNMLWIGVRPFPTERPGALTSWRLAL